MATARPRRKRGLREIRFMSITPVAMELKEEIVALARKAQTIYDSGVDPRGSVAIGAETPHHRFIMVFMDDVMLALRDTLKLVWPNQADQCMRDYFMPRGDEYPTWTDPGALPTQGGRAIEDS